MVKFSEQPYHVKVFIVVVFPFYALGRLGKECSIHVNYIFAAIWARIREMHILYDLLKTIYTALCRAFTMIDANVIEPVSRFLFYDLPKYIWNKFVRPVAKYIRPFVRFVFYDVVYRHLMRPVARQLLRVTRCILRNIVTLFRLSIPAWRWVYVRLIMTPYRQVRLFLRVLLDKLGPVWRDLKMVMSMTFQELYTGLSVMRQALPEMFRSLFRRG